MPKFRICVVNDEFESFDESECADVDAAREDAIRGATAMGAEQVTSGKPLFVAEVSVHQQATLVTRMIVSVSASPLKV